MKLIVLLFFTMTMSFIVEAQMKLNTNVLIGEKKLIPEKYVRPAASPKGNNISIPIEWSGAPKNTKSFALLMDDPHPIANNWVHWMVINIPENITEFSEGISGPEIQKLSPEIVELNNSFQTPGYGGPQPPAGSGLHPYVFTIYALSVDKLKLPKNSTRKDFLNAIQGKILDKAQVTGHFGR